MSLNLSPSPFRFCDFMRLPSPSETGVYFPSAVFLSIFFKSFCRPGCTIIAPGSYLVDYLNLLMCSGVDYRCCSYRSGRMHYNDDSLLPLGIAPAWRTPRIGSVLLLAIIGFNL